MVNTSNTFLSLNYIRHDKRRQEHLASLGLDFQRLSVLELGAGIGNHTEFFLDRNCKVLSTEPREENIQILKRRFEGRNDVQVGVLNLADCSSIDLKTTFDIVYCYGVLYHLDQPAEAIKFMATHCKRYLLLETCVSYGDESDSVNFVDEDIHTPSQSVTGKGCRPSRSWIYKELGRNFSYVYMPITQPCHEEFPVDWTLDAKTYNGRLTRAVFIASREAITNSLLFLGLPMKQQR